MIVFISTVLILAAAQSLGKLALLPRRWEMLSALLLAVLPFFFETRLAGMSLQEWNAKLTNVATLENWCALVVIQELFTLVIGFSLLADRQEDAAAARRRAAGPFRRRFVQWKYLSLLPSVLFPAGVLYFQMVIFNRFPQWEFHTLTRLMACVLPLALLAAVEGMRLFRRNPEARILAVLHLEYFLVLAAIFLPVAARAKLMAVQNEFVWRDPLLLLGGFLAAVAAGALLHYGLQTLKRKRKYVNCHPNP